MNVEDVGRKSMDPAHLEMDKGWNEINTALLPVVRVMPMVLPLPVTGRADRGKSFPRQNYPLQLPDRHQ